MASKSNAPGAYPLRPVLMTGKAPVALLARNSRRLTNELLLDDAPLLEPGV